jgi:general secretion pathway protein A
MTGPFSSFFGLADNPFRANPDPRYLVLTQQTQESLDQLIEGIRSRKGLLLLTGEVGTGKTLLLNHLMEWLDHERIPKAFIFNSHMKVSELFDLILTDFGIPFTAERGTPLAHFTNWLQDRFCAGETAVLIVDEAQGLALNVIEELCMLLNLQTPQGNLLQIILCGQPEFEEMLQRPGLRQMRQRVAVRCRTLPLTLEESRAYVGSRLRVAGGADSDAAIFHPEALQALFLYSGGIPRVLNLLCEQALMRASRDRLRPVPGNTVGEVAHLFQLDGGRPLGSRFGADGASVLELFTPRPVVGEAPRRFVAAAAPAESAALRGVYQPANSPSVDVASEPPRTPHPPIEFPSQIRPQPPVALGLKEIIAPRGLSSPSGAPTDALMAELASALVVAARDAKVQPRTPEQAFDFSKGWRRHFFSVASRARSGIAAMSSQAPIVRARVERLMLSSSQAVSRQWTALRSRNWNVRINLAWPDFATSWLHWLQAATTRHTLHRESAPVRHQGVPHPAPSARAQAVSQAAWRRLQNSAAHPQRGRNAKNTRHLTTSVLRWLQQPTRTMRSRPAAHSSSTRMA